MASFDRYVVRLDSSSDAVEVSPIDPIPAAESAPEKAEVSEGTTDFALGQEVKIQGDSGASEDGWKVSNFYTDAFGSKTYELSNGDQVKAHIEGAQLALWQAVETAPISPSETEDIVAGSADHEQGAQEGESLEEYEARLNNVEERDSTDGIDDLSNISTEPNDGIDDLHDIDVSMDKPSRRERLKSLWGNNKEKLKDYFRPNYWAAEWTTRSAINRDTREAMSDEERDKKRNRNRVVLILGATAGGIGVGILGTLIVKGMIDASTIHSAGQSGGGDIVGGGTGSSGGGDIMPPAPELPPVVPNPNFTISSGEGGIELFNKLGLNESQWYSTQSDLLRNFPNEFYQQAGEAVRINNAGPLSQDVQNFINQRFGTR